MLLSQPSGDLVSAIAVHFGIFCLYLVFDCSANFSRDFPFISLVFIDEFALRSFGGKIENFLSGVLLEIVLLRTRIRAKVESIEFVIQILVKVKIVIT